MRYAVLFALCAASCSPSSGTAEGIPVSCAIGRGSDWAQQCVLEQPDEGGFFIIHHPGGGFRRFGSDTAGTFVTLDGADPLVEHPTGAAHELEFSVGDDAYRVPVTLLRPPPND